MPTDDTPTHDSVAEARSAFAGPGTVQRMVIARESDVHNYELAAAMIEQTCNYHAGHPGVAEALDAGLAPYHDPEAYKALVHRDRRNKAVIFLLDGTLFLYWMGSAALEERLESAIASDNAFCRFTAELIQQFAPKELLLSTFSRLVRSEEYSPAVRKACIDHEVVIRAMEATLDMGHEAGQMQWSLMAMMSANERRRILQRLLLGQIRHARNGGAPLGREQLPPGYELDADGIVRVDESQQPMVAGMLEVLADTETPAREKVEALGELGVTRKRIQRLYGEHATTADVKGASLAIRALRGWLDLYETGVWTTRRDCPITGVTVFGGLPVQRDERNQPYVDIDYRWGVPDGGWAAPEVIRAAKAAREDSAQRSGRTGGATHKNRKALAGLGQWRSGQWEYALRSASKGSYQVQRRRFDENVVGRDWEHIPVGWADGIAVDEEHLHPAIADAVAAAITHGTAASAETGVLDISSGKEGVAGVRRLVVDQASRRRHLESELAQLRSKLDRLAALAGDDDGPLATSYHERARATEDAILSLEAQLNALEEGARHQPDEIVAQADVVLAALAKLANTRGPISRQLGESIALVISNLRFDVDAFDPDDPRLPFVVDAQLPGDEQVVKLDGIEGTVTARPMVNQTWKEDAPARYAHGLELLAEGVPLADIAARIGVSQQFARRQLRQLLCEQGATARLATGALTHPLEVTRRTLVGLVAGGVGDDPDPFVDRLREVYAVDVGSDASTEPVLSVIRERGRRLRQGLVDHLQANGGSVSYDEAVAWLKARTRAARQLLGTMGQPDSPSVSAYPVVRVDARSPGRSRREERRVSLRRCPQCGAGATRVVPLPESRGVLCEPCRINVDDPGIVLPADYLDVRIELDDTLESQPRKQPRRRVLEQLATLDNAKGWTCNEVVEATGTSRSHVDTVVDDGRRDGWIEAVGPCPDHVGDGLVPTRWRLVGGQLPAEATATQRSRAEGLSRSKVLAVLPDGKFAREHVWERLPEASKSAVENHLRKFAAEGLTRRVGDAPRRGQPSVYELTAKGVARREAAQAPGSDERSPKAARALEYIATLGEATWTVHDVAEATGCSRSLVNGIARDGEVTGCLEQAPSGRAGWGSPVRQQWRLTDPDVDLRAAVAELGPRPGWDAASEILVVVPDDGATIPELHEKAGLRYTDAQQAVADLRRRGHLSSSAAGTGSGTATYWVTEQGRAERDRLLDSE